MNLRSIFLRLLFFFSFLSVYAQKDSSLIRINSSLSSLTSTRTLNALYSYANKYGVYDQNDLSQSILHLSGEATLLKRKIFRLDVGAGVILNNNWSSSFLHEFYAKGNLLCFDYSVGKEAFSPLVINDNLSSGLIYGSTNSAPYYRAIGGLFSYRSVPYTGGWVQVKGAFGIGVLDDNRESYGKSYPLIMDQFLYLRMGNSWIKPYLGLTHSALFGGKDYAGNSVPIDFWASFFAKGSAKLGGGEETNAAGAHGGYYDFGFYLSCGRGSLQFYYQKPIRDGSSLYLNKGYNRDYVVGVSAKLAGISWLKEISLEGIKTTYQSGPGMLDLAYPAGHPKSGQLIFPNEIIDYDAFMKDEFGKVVHGWTKDDFTNYFRSSYNHGYEYGGRDNYLNNGSYYGGWTYRGMVMGTPLFHTATQFESYSGQEYSPRRSFIVNNRVTGFHLGLAGDVIDRLSYKAKFTYTKNLGTYQDEYEGAMSWVEAPNYYYKGGLYECYSFLELSRKHFLVKNLTIGGSLGFDWGELYNTISGGLMLSYNI